MLKYHYQILIHRKISADCREIGSDFIKSPLQRQLPPRSCLSLWSSQTSCYEVQVLGGSQSNRNFRNRGSRSCISLKRGVVLWQNQDLLKNVLLNLKYEKNKLEQQKKKLLSEQSKRERNIKTRRLVEIGKAVEATLGGPVEKEDLPALKVLLVELLENAEHKENKNQTD